MKTGFSTKELLAIGIVAVALIGVAAYALPQYQVYSARMHGEAELARATQNRQVLVQTAQAERDAEILRAEGTAKANKIIGESLKENSEYLRWLWISKLDNQTNKTVVYVPTDGMVPQLETGRIGEEK
ncbi:hypothetical protein [Novacetimonas pomaceti]|uniref:hypothetical protein n=1 Tax=Novacetimonas pomaceti TaxID=2021998 RepID=UPI001C2D14EE|nr:hypothetical protein [Novacetimonas pomaceti]MBV1835104.1 hypothetical protein [Novacetimonas pomaceti]